jgi:uncharacterized membrane protein YwzB
MPFQLLLILPQIIIAIAIAGFIVTYIKYRKEKAKE